MASTPRCGRLLNPSPPRLAACPRPAPRPLRLPGGLRLLVGHRRGRDHARGHGRGQVDHAEAGGLARRHLQHGGQPGVTTSEREHIKALEREVKELRRANDILKAASAFFAQAELDRRLKN